MIIRKNIEDVALSTLQGLTLLESLKKYKLNPMEFHKHLKKYPEDAELFTNAKITLIENELSQAYAMIENSDTKLDLDKANARIGITKWLAEKIIPDTYGTKLHVEQNVTIDIRQVLLEANERVSRIVMVDNVVADVGKSVDEVIEDSAPLLGADEMLDGGN